MTILLISKEGKEREFGKVHALALLAMKSQNWKLPEGSPYEYINGDLRKKSDKGDIRSSKKRRGDTKG